MATPTETRLYKPAETPYPILDLIRKRFSPRAFDSRPIEKDKLVTILEAARWAASAMNAQPWRFIVATRDNEAEFQKMLLILREGNQKWAKDAPVLMLAVAHEEHDGGQVNRYAEHDTGQALAYIAVQAMAYDIYLRMMGGFYPDKAREIYNIPQGYKPLTALALGYHGTLEQLEESILVRERHPRTRKPLTELVFSGDWENTADLVK